MKKINAASLSKGEDKTMTKKTIPDFQSEKEEQEFWETHHPLDGDMEFVTEPVEVDPMARSQPISIRLPKWLITNIKVIAAEMDMPYQTLIKECLKDFVALKKGEVVKTSAAG
jgi:predicted DNA binding CopG/RHH family protein